MKEWYKPVEKLGYEFEYSISENSSLSDNVGYIRRITELLKVAKYVTKGSRA